MALNKLSSLKKSYLYDWLIFIIMFILFQIINSFKAIERQFAIDDISISHPHKEDTIKMVYLLSFCLIITPLIMVLFQKSKNRMGFDLHQAIIGVTFSYMLTCLIGVIIKKIGGRLRPDFLTVCQPDYALIEQQYNHYNLSSEISYGPRNLFNSSICTAPEKEVLKERTSFPSSHTYTVFSIMSYLALYIAAQIHLLDKKCYVWKFVVVAIPYIFSIIVAMSRVFDYRHHWEDVVFGGLLGLIISTITYFYYYPSLSDPNCDIPYQNRKEIENKDNRNKGEEYVVMNEINN